MNRRKQDKLNSARRTIEEILEKHSCLNDLESLTGDGCDRIRILVILSALWAGQEISEKEKSWESLAGMNRRSLRAALSRWRASAQEIERFDRSFLGWVLAVELEHKYFLSTPKLIRRCADTVESQLALVGPKKRSFLNSSKAYLVAYVHQTTQHWHDEEVSALISAMKDSATLKDRSYDIERHRKWRRAHRSLIEVVKKELLADEPAVEEPIPQRPTELSIPAVPRTNSET